MKIYNVVKKMHLAIAASTIMALSSSAYANTNAPLNVQPSPVYHAVKNQSLAETLKQVSQRSGIAFKINTDLGNDVVRQSIAAEDWKTAIKSLLKSYNYTVINEGQNIKTVLITGHNGSQATPLPVASGVSSEDAHDLIEIKSKITDLPTKYQGYPAGAVMPVHLPVKDIMNIPNNKTVDLDLPIGQYAVTHDSTVSENDGSKTWVGHLDNEGMGYRVFLSQGPGGTMGTITTPDGHYNVETDGGQAFLVDTSKLSSAGYEGDTASTDATLDAAMAQNAALTTPQLQAAMDSAKAKLDAAQTAVTNGTALLATSTAKASAANSALVASKDKQVAAMATVNAALSAYRAKPSAASITALTTATNQLSTASAAYNTAFLASNSANSNVTAATAALAVKKSALATAKANYDLAVKAYNDATSAVSKTPLPAPPIPVAPAPTTSSGNDTVVDIMVLYTTQGYTADYAKQRIAFLVTASNQAYVDSGINMKIRLVYAEPTAYSDKTSNLQALTDLAKNAGAFAGISQKRVQYGADLVYLFRPLYATVAGSCGTTYLEMANGSPANKGLGFGTISDGSSKDSMTNTYCAINTFTHEIGHSLGLAHDREYSNAAGAFSYSYAWGIDKQFGTIMSYKSPVVMYFSTPTLATKCAGTPCGYPETDASRSSDQVKTVNIVAPTIASFMPTMTTTPVIK